MEINTQDDIETDNDSISPLPPPQFDEAMISQAQQVEPLDASGRRKWRAGSAGDFLRGRVGLLAVILVTLLLGAAAFGMLLGFRDRQSAIAEPTTANQATPEPTEESEVTTTPVKTQPVSAAPAKSLARTPRDETPEPEPKLISPQKRVRRTVRVGLDDIEQALARPRKVGEIGGGRDDRRDRKRESKDRKRDKDDHD